MAVDRKRLVVRGLVATALVAAAAGAYASFHTRFDHASAGPPPGSAPPPPSLSAPPEIHRAPASPAERAILAPLTEGSSLEGFEVKSILTMHEGSLRLVLRRGGESVRLDVALFSPASPSPPASTDKYAIYYSLNGGATREDGERLALALGKVLEANAKAPAPPGMTPFTAKQSGTEL